MKKIIDKIVNKKFEYVINGYSPSNVDSFLDNIIKDLKELEDNYQNLLNDKNALDEELDNLKLENKRLKLELEKMQKTNEISLEKENIFEENEKDK